MIKTLEEYEEIKRDVNFDISTRDEKSLLETIEVLRTVARLAPNGTLCDADSTGIYALSCDGNCDGHKLQRALDALPAWALEGDQ